MPARLLNERQSASPLTPASKKGQSRFDTSTAANPSSGRILASWPRT